MNFLFGGKTLNLIEVNNLVKIGLQLKKMFESMKFTSVRVLLFFKNGT